MYVDFCKLGESYTQNGKVGKRTVGGLRQVFTFQKLLI